MIIPSFPEIDVGVIIALPDTFASKMPALSFDRLNDKHYQKAANSSFAVLNFFRIEGECGDYDMPILSESLECELSNPPIPEMVTSPQFSKRCDKLNTPKFLYSFFIRISPYTDRTTAILVSKGMTSLSILAHLGFAPQQLFGIEIKTAFCATYAQFHHKHLRARALALPRNNLWAI